MMNNKSESDKQPTEYDPRQNRLFISVDDTKYTCKEIIHMVRSYYKAIKVLRIYANRSNWSMEYTDAFCCMDGWEMAQDCLKEIEE